MSTTILEEKAIKVARLLVRNRVCEELGVKFELMAPTEKQKVEGQVDKKVKLIRRLAKRIVEEGFIEEVRTAISPSDHLAARRAQETRGKKTRLRNNINFPKAPQGLPSSRLPKQLTPASKIPSYTIDSFQHDDKHIIESYDSFNIVKPAGFGTLMTAKDLGIKIKAGFSHHPTVEEEIEEKKK